VASGGFAVEEAVSFPLVERARDDAAALDELRSRMLAPAAALRGVPQVGVNEQGVIDVSHGRALVSERLASGEWPADGVEPVAVIDPGGELIALGRTNAGRIEVMRGIHPTPR
jgi:hypothetical protein